MPIYEYLCQDCRSEFETLVRNAAERDRAACPRCRSERVTRKLSAFAVAAAPATSAGSACGAACPGGACDFKPSHSCGTGCCGF